MLITIDVSLIVEQICKNLSPTKTRRGNCLVLPHTGYALVYWPAIVNIRLALFCTVFLVIWPWIIPWPWNLSERSLTVIQTGTIRKLGVFFPFAFHSNYGSILYQFRDKATYWWKNRDTPHVFDAPISGSLSGHCHPVWYEKPRMMGLSDGVKSLRLCTSYKRLYAIPACDGQTERRTNTA